MIVVLCHALSPHFISNLKMVDVSKNPFGSIGAEALLHLAQKHPNLINIVVDDVEIVPAVHRKLIDALVRNDRVPIPILADSTAGSPDPSMTMEAIEA